MAGLADYLAKNYLTADSSSKEKKSKKRKRKDPTSAGLTIADDDTTGWEKSKSSRDDDEVRPTIVAGRTTEFRKSKQNNFVTVGDPAPKDADQDAADKILANAAAEREAERAADDEAPQIVGDDAEDEGKNMQSGAAAGLQTAAQVAAAVEKKRARELRKAQEAEQERLAAEGGQGGGETIYRDATGRITNVAMKRAEARKQAEDEERKKREDIENAKGDVQRAAKAKRRDDLEDAKFMTVARYADDKELNAEMKERDRWNDPAAGFIEKKDKGKSITGRPLYQGPAAPNRYGIRPGWRWDGVDRSSGFEKQWFAARNKQANRRDLEYAWQMDE